MQTIAFCSRCRGMRVGWNARYIAHRLRCKEWASRSSKLLILTVLVSILAFTFQTPSAFVFSELNSNQQAVEAGVQPQPTLALDPAAQSMAGFLSRYKVADEHRDRVANAIITSSRKYNVDPRLVASIMIVESRANPLAISDRGSIGIMQIHLSTWGHTADREGINLFKIEDNVDFGVRILNDYIHRYGLWEGVKRYKGWNSDSPGSTQAVEDYLKKVRRIYSNEKPATDVLE